MDIFVNVLVLRILILFVSGIKKPCLGDNPTDTSIKLMTASFRVTHKISTMRVYGAVLMKL